jgi:hypothetical protein
MAVCLGKSWNWCRTIPEMVERTSCIKSPYLHIKIPWVSAEFSPQIHLLTKAMRTILAEQVFSISLVLIFVLLARLSWLAIAYWMSCPTLRFWLEQMVTR